MASNMASDEEIGGNTEQAGQGLGPLLAYATLAPKHFGCYSLGPEYVPQVAWPHGAGPHELTEDVRGCGARESVGASFEIGDERGQQFHKLPLGVVEVFFPCGEYFGQRPERAIVFSTSSDGRWLMGDQQLFVF